jgi:hypothetical protein
VSQRKLWLSLISIFGGCGLTHCIRPPEKGRLVVQAQDPGVYEIYKTMGDSSLQFVSSELGKFNEPLALEPGSYLVLGDCSHEQVLIHPGETSHLSVTRVRFTFTPPTQVPDLFTIQCSRFEMTNLRQSFSNQFVFHVFSGKREVLAGMVPLRLDIPLASHGIPPERIFTLASIQVHAAANITHHSPYFVSPTKNLLSITQPIEADHRIFLLPGSYQVSMNGTQQVVTLGADEHLEIHSAILGFYTSPGIDTTLHQAITGEPYFVQLNEKFRLDLNRPIPVLPGYLNYQLEDSSKIYNLNLPAGESTRIELKSLIVHSGCAPWEWECMGKKEVYLFQKHEPYPFTESVMDVPIYFVENEVYAAVASSKGLHLAVPHTKKDHELFVGKLIVTPSPIYTPGLIGELVRIEPVGEPVTGYSRDIAADTETSFTLLAGNYNLAQYIGLVNSSEGERIKRDLPFSIQKGSEKRLRYHHYVNDYKAKLLVEKQASSRDEKLKIDPKFYERF